MRNPHCKECPLHAGAQTVCLWGSGPKRADVVIVGEAPGREEDAQGIPFVGNAGRLLDDLLAKAGIDRDDCYVTNAVKCRPPGNRDPTATEIDACRKYLEEEIDAASPSHILLLGNAALKSVLGQTGITRERGRPSSHNGITVMPCLHPASIFYQPANAGIIEQDLRYFRGLMRRGFIPPVEPGVRPILVDTRAKVAEMLNALTGVISLDLETGPTERIRNPDERKRAGLYPWLGHVVAVGFGTANAQYALLVNHRDSPWSRDDIDNILADAAVRLERCYVIAQNGKFDQLWLKVKYGISIELAFDTMLAHFLLDENQYHDLEYLARMYFQAPAWDISLEEKQGAASDIKLANYLAHDLFYTRQLFPRLNEQIAADPLLNRLYHHLVMPLANAFVRIEAHGAFIDHSQLDDAEVFLNEEIDKAEAALLQYADINWASSRQVADVLYNQLKLKCPTLTEKGAPSTAESVLNQLDHPVAAAIKRLRAARQEHGLFIKGWEPYLTPSRGEWRLHPAFKLSGTVTGRASCEHPNLQQTTRAPRVRSLIKAPPGWQLIEADLSQIELRIIAELSADPTMRETFCAGRDIHWTTALREIERGVGHHQLVMSTASTLRQSKVINYGTAIRTLLDAGPDAAAEVDRTWKELRNGAKAVNFGYCATKGTKVTIPAGHKKIEDINPGDFVYSYDENLKPCIRRVIAQKYTGMKECYRLYWQGGRGNSGHLDLTPDHRVRMVDGNYKTIKELMATPFKRDARGRPRRNLRVLALHRIFTNGRNWLRATGGRRDIQESRLLFEQFNGWSPEEVHHINGDSADDRPANLEGLTAYEHAKRHRDRAKRYDLTERKVRRALAGGGIVHASKVLGCSYETVRARMREFGISGYGYNGNHWIKKIKRLGRRPTYDIEVEGTHNFIANEICISNSFGMYWKKFRMYARDTYGIEITDKQAQQSRIAFFQLYDRLERWHEQQRNVARLQGYVRSLDGQKRRLPEAQQAYDSPEKQEAYRQAINSPVQCFAARINWMVMLQMLEEFPWSVFRPIATVHDSILAEVRNDYVERVARRIFEVMRAPALFSVFDIDLSIPLDGEAKIGPWGSGVSLSKYLAAQKAAA